MPRKTAALLVLILTAATVHPLVCAWWCAPEQAVHESCHESSPASGTQLSSPSSCFDVLNDAARMTKTRSLERVVFVPVVSSAGVRDVAWHPGMASWPPGLPPPAALHPPTILRI